MPAFADLQPAGFDFIPFMVRTVTVTGGMRHQVHEYPHQPAGESEKLGRKLYRIEMEVEFSTNFRAYPTAWPNDLSDLRDRFEQGVTSELVIPTIGTIKAFAIDWTQTAKAGRADGETCRFVFLEDEAEALLTDQVAQTQFQYIPAALEALVLAAEEVGLGDAVQSIENFAGDVAAVADGVQLQADAVASKVDQLTGACQLLDETLKDLDEPPHHKVGEALRNLTVASITLGENVMRRANPVSVFTTTATMAASDIARLLYGDTSRTVEILKLNPIRDAFSIPANTQLKVYAT